MAVVMEMPKLSDTMKEGAIARWLVKEGQKVQSGLPIVEIDTDKATMEFESPASGLLLKILVGDGQSCALQAPIAVIGKEGEAWQAAVEAHANKKGLSSANSSKSKENVAPEESKDSKLSLLESKSDPASATSDPLSTERIKASPLAKKMAQENGISLSKVSGSGPSGRVVAKDIDSLISNKSLSAAASANQKISAGFGIRKVPVTMMRKTIAKRLVESVQQAPHFYLSVSLNMGPLLDWRKSLLGQLPEARRFSVNDAMVYLVARALKKHPEINSSWQEDHIIQYSDAHVGIAVALPNGLITPVVRHADSLNIFDIASATKDLIKLAKEGKLTPESYTGGTFTISNLGMAGIEEFTAIINPPQAAILAIGSTLPTPAVNSAGQVIVEQRLKVTLSCDHRVIDGAMGAEFLKTLKSLCENPWNLLVV